MKTYVGPLISMHIHRFQKEVNIAKKVKSETRGKHKI
jgi:hypothetical protein